MYDLHILYKYQLQYVSATKPCTLKKTKHGSTMFKEVSHNDTNMNATAAVRYGIIARSVKGGHKIVHNNHRKCTL